MCGIVGYIGKRKAWPILVEGLKRLEYRGYDSAGAALMSDTHQLNVYKSVGKVADLERTAEGQDVSGCVGIAHTRWATHGEPSTVNAHPHCSQNGDLALVHNGIIENYAVLKEKLQAKGCTFKSSTDTEVLVQLIGYIQQQGNLDLLTAVQLALREVIGAYAIAVVDRKHPDEIIAARKSSPLVVGVGEGEFFLASDATPMVTYTNQVVYLSDGEIAVLRADAPLKIVDLNNVECPHEAQTVALNIGQLEKGGFPHFMLKEIHEQPKVVKDTLHSLRKDDVIDLSTVGLTDEEIRQFSQIYIVACGSAWHVGMAAQYVIEDLAKLPVRVELASEFRYRNMILDPNGLVILISQSGETADTLAALREAKKKGLKTLAIVNVVGSSIAREADYVCYTMAGPEISVATTKAYTAQLILSYLLAIKFGVVRGEVTDEVCREYLDELETIPDKIEQIMENKERLQWFAAKFASAHDVFFVGRGIDYAISLEGSLKMKEISYIHSEAYAAGELKHGTISLIEKGTLVIGILTQDDLYEKTLSNMVECKSRGAYLMGITTYGHYEMEDTADFVTYIPKVDHHFIGSLAVIPLQLIGYYISAAKGLDVDKPRNLAKSVTVE